MGFNLVDLLCVLFLKSGDRSECREKDKSKKAMNERMEKYSGAFGNYCKRQNDGLICAQFLVFLFLFLSGIFLFLDALH